MLISKLLKRINMSKVEEPSKPVRFVGNDNMFSFYNNKIKDYDIFKHEYECSVIAENPLCTKEEFVIAIKNRALLIEKVKELANGFNE